MIGAMLLGGVTSRAGGEVQVSGHTDVVAEAGVRGTSSYRFAGVFYYPRPAAVGVSVAYSDNWDPGASSEMWVGAWVRGRLMGVPPLTVGANVVVAHRAGEDKRFDTVIAALWNGPLLGMARLRGRYFLRIPVATGTTSQRLDAFVSLPIGTPLTIAAGYSVSVSRLDEPTHWPAVYLALDTSLGTAKITFLYDWSTAPSRSGIEAQYAVSLPH